jgi:hypothetical protein
MRDDVGVSEDCTDGVMNLKATETNNASVGLTGSATIFVHPLEVAIDDGKC